MNGKPAKIKQDTVDRCEAIARGRRMATGEHINWSAVLAEAQDAGLKVLERKKKKNQELATKATKA